MLQACNTTQACNATQLVDGLFADLLQVEIFMCVLKENSFTDFPRQSTS